MKIKACPFCGGEAKYVQVARGSLGGGYIACIRETECGASVPGGGTYTRKALAIERWNRRGWNS